MAKNLPCNAGDIDSIPDWGTGIPHAAGQLSICAANYQAHKLWSLWSTTREHVHHNQRIHAPQQKIPIDMAKILRAATKTQHSQIIKWIYKYFLKES